MKESTRIRAWAWFGAAATLALTPAPAQAQKTNTIPRSSLAHEVPAQVGLFAELHVPPKKQGPLSTVQLGALARLMTGGPDSSWHLDLDWKTLIRRNLGLGAETLLAELSDGRIALAAPTWERLSEAVILLQFKKTRFVGQLVTASGAQPLEKRGRVQLYRTSSDLLMAIDGRLVILAQAGDAEELFREIVALRTGGKGSRLANEQTFTGQVGKLRRGHSGYVFLSAGADAEGGLARVFPEFVAAAVGIYARSGRVDFDIRARLTPDKSPARQIPIDTERLRRLPDSILFAWAGTMDLAGSLGRLLDPAASVADDGGYLELLGTILGAGALDRQVVAQLGPRVIVVWDRDRGGADLPQLTVMVESGDSNAAATALAEAFADLANSLAGAWDPDAVLARVERREHLDAHMLVVDLNPLLADKVHLAAGLDLMSNMQPTFAALDGWVMAATHPQAIKQIIDADRGWIPRISGIRGLGLHWRRIPERRVSLTVAQPAMASAVLAWWQGQDGTRQGWGLGEMLGSYRPAVGQVARPALGIAIKPGGRAGSVRVERVHAHQPAMGKLQVGDEIVGVNGEPLRLGDPLDDLRRRIDECQEPALLTLDVWRADAQIEVLVPLPEAVPVPVDEPSTDPGAALRRLQSVGKRLSQFTYAVYRSSPTQFYGRASLKFVPTKKEPAVK